MNVQSHYKNHLAKFYTWMSGSYDELVEKQKIFFIQNNIQPSQAGISVAIDLGCGPGYQSVALKSLGFRVHAVDLSEELMSELAKKDSSIERHLADIRDLEFAALLKPELIVCMGDTITHLSDLNEVRLLLTDAFKVLTNKGKLIFTFRNLTAPLEDENRFFIVKGEPHKILTCFLEGEKDKVKVFDLLHEFTNGSWKLSKSFYRKLKINPAWLVQEMVNLGFSVSSFQLPSGMDAIIGQKK